MTWRILKSLSIRPESYSTPLKVPKNLIIYDGGHIGFFAIFDDTTKVALLTHFIIFSMA